MGEGPSGLAAEPTSAGLRSIHVGQKRTPGVTAAGVEKLEGSRLADAYSRHSPSAIRLAFLLTGDAQLAEDLAQDAFVKLAGRYFQYRGDASFDAYLRQTVVNLTRSHARRRKVEADRIARSRIELAGASNASDPIEKQEALRLLSLLTYRQRAAVVLRLYVDLSERETAELLGCKPGTVKSLLSRAMDVLRKELEEADDE
jgi:RNA polymerase sigma factor (sigma-70 family)